MLPYATIFKRLITRKIYPGYILAILKCEFYGNEEETNSGNVLFE